MSAELRASSRPPMVCQSHRVLIADDDPVVRTVLEDLVTGWGYEAVVTSDGAEAWSVLQQPNAPALVLLDWMMPPPDGIELCRRLSARAADGGRCYAIVVTSKENRDAVVQAFEAGADDFLRKPLDADELRSRLNAGNRILTYDRLLAERNAENARYAAEMESLAESRAQQLVHADRMATLGTMAAGMAHEVNNPVSFISGNIQVLQNYWRALSPVLEAARERNPENDQLRIMLEEMPKMLRAMRGGVSRITELVKRMKGFAYRGQGDMVTTQMNRCVEDALDLCHNALKKHVRVETYLSPGLPEVRAHVQEMEQVLANLFLNAVDALQEKKEDAVLRVVTEPISGGVRVVVEDNGPGVAASQKESVWQPFFTSKPPGKGTGLGLSISQGIVQQHGGSIRLEDRPGGGARFVIELPYGASSAASRR